MRKAAGILAVFSLLPAAMAQSAEARRIVMETLEREADKFAGTVPQIQGREVLQQTRRPNIQRQIVSDYGFFAMQPGNIHEIRVVQSVDGKPVRQRGDGLKDVARNVMAADDKQRRRLLESFEKHGLQGVAIDFGPTILLFTSANIQKFEFAFLRMDAMDGSEVAVYRYEQVDGAGGMTIFAEGKPIRQRVQGELWARPASGMPVRIVLDTDHQEGRDRIRDFTFVDYARSEFGPLLPTLVVHRQFRDRTLLVQDLFRYSAYRKL